MQCSINAPSVKRFIDIITKFMNWLLNLMTNKSTQHIISIFNYFHRKDFINNNKNILQVHFCHKTTTFLKWVLQWCWNKIKIKVQPKIYSNESIFKMITISFTYRNTFNFLWKWNEDNKLWNCCKQHLLKKHHVFKFKSRCT